MWQISTLCAVVVLVGLATVARGEILKREPALGKLKPGQTVLVDDGVCPKGQIKKVIGGDHLKVGGRYQVERQRKCVPK